MFPYPEYDRTSNFVYFPFVKVNHSSKDGRQLTFQLTSVSPLVVISFKPLFLLTMTTWQHVT